MRGKIKQLLEVCPDAFVVYYRRYNREPLCHMAVYSLVNNEILGRTTSSSYTRCTFSNMVLTLSKQQQTPFAIENCTKLLQPNPGFRRIIINKDKWKEFQLLCTMNSL